MPSRKEYEKIIEDLEERGVLQEKIIDVQGKMIDVCTAQIISLKKEVDK